MSLEGQHIGRYALLHLLGSGGMGEVYLATDTPINRQVAIKVMRSDAAPYPDADSTHNAARLFQREVRAIAALGHPHISLFMTMARILYAAQKLRIWSCRTARTVPL